MRHHHAQPEDPGERRQQRGPDRMDMDEIRPLPSRMEHGEERTDDRFEPCVACRWQRDDMEAVMVEWRAVHIGPPRQDRDVEPWRL